MLQTALVLGNDRHTLTVIRSLSRLGYKIIVGRQTPSVFTQFSRFVDDVWDHPIVKDADAFMATLVGFLARSPDISLVFPIGESELEVFADNMSRVPAGVRVAMTEPTTLRRCLNKLESYTAARDAGIPVPEYRSARSISELMAAHDEIGYPCIVKPNRSSGAFFGQKAIIFRTADDVKRRFCEWPAGTDVLIVQRYVAGYRPNCQAAAYRGKLLAYFEHDVTRTDKIDATGFEVHGVSVPPTPVLREYCRALLDRLDYSGVAGIQFIAGNDGYHFLEINPRLDATCALPYACGVDFPRFAAATASSGELPALPADLTRPLSSYRAGVRAHWLWGDLQGLYHSVARKEVGVKGVLDWTTKLGYALATADLHVTFTWRDPVPTLALYRSLLRWRWRRRKSPRMTRAVEAE